MVSNIKGLLMTGIHEDFLLYLVNGPEFLDNDEAVPFSMLYGALCPVGI